MRNRFSHCAVSLFLTAVSGFLPTVTARSQEILMPDVIGMRPEAAQDTLARLGLGELTVDDSLSGSEPGFVIGQDPVPDVEVAVGEPIRLWVSVSSEPAPELVEVPDLLGRHVDEAIEILAETRLTRGELSPVPSDARLGVVLRQDPGAGEAVEPETPVHLAVSAGDEEVVSSAVVPDVVGRSIEEAEEMIVEARLAVGRIDVRGRWLERSRVVRQDPPPGTGVRPGSSVNLLLAAPEMRPAPFPWPPILGGLVATVAVSSFLVARHRRSRRKPHRAGGRMKLRTVNETDALEVRSSDLLISGPEVRLRPVPDTGTQAVETQGPLTGSERSEDG